MHTKSNLQVEQYIDLNLNNGVAEISSTVFLGDSSDPTIVTEGTFLNLLERYVRDHSIATDNKNKHSLRQEDHDEISMLLELMQQDIEKVKNKINKMTLIS